MDYKLLPCPFCGAIDPEADWDAGGLWTVECTDCGASSGHISTDSKQSAVAAWNRRPLRVAGDDIVGRLRELAGDSHPPNMHMWGQMVCGEAADEIERLRAELAAR